MSAAGVPNVLGRDHVHTVQFYGDDGVLLHELNGYIGSALKAGSSAIIIATHGHLDNLARKLKSNGVNLARATGEGRYVALEANGSTDRFVVLGHARRFTRPRGVCPGRVHSRCRRSFLPDSAINSAAPNEERMPVRSRFPKRGNWVHLRSSPGGNIASQ